MEDDRGSPPPDAGEAAGGSAAAPDAGKTKAVRQQKTPLQREVLEASYRLNPFPTAEVCRMLAQRIQLDEKQVTAWFMGRRRKDKKQAEEAKQQQQQQQDHPPPAPPSAPLPPPQVPPTAASVPEPAAPAPAPVTSPAPAAQPSPGLQPPQPAAPAAHTSPAIPAPAQSPPQAPLSTSSTPAVAAAPQPPAPAVPIPAPVAAPSQNPAPPVPSPPQSQPQPMPVLAPAPALPGLMLGAPQPPAPRPPPPPNAPTPAPPAPGAPIQVVMPPTAAGVRPMLELGRIAAAAGPADLQVHVPGLPPMSVHEQAALLQAARATLEVPFRQDGPPLAFEFDPIPGAAAAHMGLPAIKRKREEQATPGAPQGFPPVAGPYAGLAKADAQRLREAERAERERRKIEERLEKERAKEEARLRKEQERQRAIQEREAKKLEAQKEKERRAEEKKREKEDKKKEKEAAKAAERTEKAAARTTKSAAVSAPAGPPDDEDLEMDKLLAEQRAAAQQAGTTPATAAAAASAEGSQAAGEEGDNTPAQHPALPTPERPLFPPASLGLGPAFQGGLEGDELGPDVLMVSAFCHSFAEVLGLRPPPTAEHIAQAVYEGESSPVLAALNIALLRVMQADMEESHAQGAAQASVGGVATVFDRGVIIAAKMLEEAWAWGYDTSVWRAHLNVLTWPEVLRELAVAATVTHEKPRPKKAPGGGKGGYAGSKPKLGEAGEDLEEDASGGLRLRMPARFTPGSVKAAAWMVLTSVGPTGIGITDLARRIQEDGLRDLRSSRTPEASIAGALSRDAVFTRVSPATFALTSIITHQEKLLGVDKDRPAGPGAAKPGGKGGGAGKAGEGGADGEGQEPGSSDVKMEEGGGGGGEGGDPPVKREEDGSQVKTEPGHDPMDVDGKEGGPGAGEDDEEGDEEEEGEEEEEGGAGEEGGDQPKVAPWSREGWVNALAAVDYSVLSVRERLDALVWLVNLVNEGPSVRAALDARIEDVANLRKMQLEESKNEKKKKQDEAAAKAKAAAEEAMRRLQALKDQAAASAASNPETGPDSNLAAQMLAAAEAASMATQKASTSVAEDAAEERAAAARRHEAVRRVEEERPIRLEPVGLDRRHNRYWRFGLGAAMGDAAALAAFGPDLLQGDPSLGRLFIESGGPDSSSWQLLSQAEQLDQLSAVLEPRGIREGHLIANLSRQQATLKKGMPSSPLSPPGSHQVTTVSRAMVQRMREVTPQAALYNVSTSRVVARTAGTSLASSLAAALPGPRTSAANNNLAAAVPRAAPSNYGGLPADASGSWDELRIKKLKADLLAMGNALQGNAVAYSFDRFAWVQSVAAAGTPAALRLCLGQLEAAVMPPALSPGYQRNPHIQKAAWTSPQRMAMEQASAAAATEAAAGHAAAASGGQGASKAEDAGEGAGADSAGGEDGSKQEPGVSLGLAEPLSWLPPTWAAVALRLQALDAAVHYNQAKRCGRDRLVGYRYVLRPTPIIMRDSIAAATAAVAAGSEAPGGQQHGAAANGNAEGAGQQQDHPAEGDDDDEEEVGTALPTFVLGSSLEGVVPLALGPNILPSGKLRQHYIMPVIPPIAQAIPPQEFSIDVEEYKAEVEEAQAAGTLYPAPPPEGKLPALPVPTLAPAGRGRGGRGPGAAARAEAAAMAAAAAASGGPHIIRAANMARASAAVRSLQMRAIQAAAGRGKGGGGGADKHPTTTAGAGRGRGGAKGKAKGRQSALSREWQKQQLSDVEDDDGPDRDYGEGYEDEFDEYLFEGAVGARGRHQTPDGGRAVGISEELMQGDDDY